MTWRTYLMNAIECILNLPASLTEETCHEVSAGLLGGLISGLLVLSVSGIIWLSLKAVGWLYCFAKTKHSFVVFFRLGNHGLSDFTDFQKVSLGIHKLDVMVRVDTRINIEHADLRFVTDTKHLQHPRSDADTNFIEILDARDLDISPPRFSSVTGYDQAGGVDLNYSPSYRRVSGEFIRIQITVHAKREWEGYLSFRESRIYSTHPFRVVNGEALQDRRDKLRRVLTLSTEGLGLCNQRIAASQYVSWNQQAKDWEGKFLESANALDPDLKVRLGELGSVPKWHCDWALHEDHRTVQNRIYGMRSILSMYLDQAHTE